MKNWNRALLLGCFTFVLGCQSFEENGALPADSLLVQTGSAVFKIDPNTRKEQRLFDFRLSGHPFDLMYDIAMSPQGKLYGVSGTWLYMIDPTSGALRAMRRVDDLGTVNAATFLPDGRLLICGTGIKILNLETNTVTRLVPEGRYISSGDIALHANGYLYWSVNESWSGTGDTLVRVNVATGQVQTIGIMGERGVYGLAYVGDQLIGFTSSGRAILINPLNAATTRIAYYSENWFGATSTPAGVTPQPTATPSPTATPTVTPTVTPTAPPTVTPSPTATPTVSPTVTPSPSATPTVIPSATPTSTPTATPSPTPTQTPCVGLTCGGGIIGI